MKITFPLILLILSGVMSCSNPTAKNTGNQKDTTSSASEESDTLSNARASSAPADTGNRNFTFIARKDSVICTPAKNNGGQVISMFTPMDYDKNVHDLRIVALNDSVPALHLNSITIHLYTSGKLTTGSYPILRFDTVEHWVGHCRYRQAK